MLRQLYRSLSLLSWSGAPFRLGGAKIPCRWSCWSGVCKTIRISNENIVFALGVKFLVLILGAVGRANMWAAVFADVGVSVIAILNAIRAMRVKQFETPAQE